MWVWVEISAVPEAAILKALAMTPCLDCDGAWMGISMRKDKGLTRAVTHREGKEGS